jgi:hypothetical protein
MTTELIDLNDAADESFDLPAPAVPERVVEDILAPACFEAPRLFMRSMAIAAALAMLVSLPEFSAWSRDRAPAASRPILSGAAEILLSAGSSLGLDRLSDASRDLLGWTDRSPEILGKPAPPRLAGLTSARPMQARLPDVAAVVESLDRQAAFSSRRAVVVKAASARPTGAHRFPVPAQSLPGGASSVLLVGDSIGVGLGWSMGRLVKTHGVSLTQKTVTSSGLVQPEYHDWNGEIAELLREQEFDAAVVVLGANDCQAMMVSRGKPAKFGTPEWDAAYRARVRSIIRTLADAGITTFWVGLPVMRGETYDRHVEHINGIFQSEAASGGAFFISTREVTAGDDGEFTSFLRLENGREVRIRLDDGIHFNVRGYDFLAGHIIGELRRRIPDVVREPPSS